MRVLPAVVEVWHEGQRVAVHERCYGRRQQVLDLEHYLEVLGRKPGALAGSRPLAQWRKQGRWSRPYDELWQSLQQRHGKGTGTRLMIEVLQLGRRSGYGRLTRAIEQALALGTHDAAAVRYLLVVEMEQLDQAGSPPLLSSDAAALANTPLARHFVRPLPSLDSYDLLLGPEPLPGLQTSLQTALQTAEMPEVTR